MMLFALFSLFAIEPTLAASKYYTLGSNRVATWSVNYDRYYYNDLKFKIRLRSAANLVAYTWKDTGNCNTDYFLGQLNTQTHSVNIPYSNSLVVHPWPNGLGSVEVDARNKYCVALHCHGENNCQIEYDYHTEDGCWAYDCGDALVSGGEFICGRYNGCGCTWDLVWKCNQCWYGPCNCGYHHEACYCYPYCARNNKREEDEMFVNRTIFAQTPLEDEYFNRNNYLIDKNISIDNCFQNSVEVYNRTYERVASLEEENQKTHKMVNDLEGENHSLMIGLVILIVITLFTGGILVGFVGYYCKRNHQNGFNN